jgi:hypothetical protein
MLTAWNRLPMESEAAFRQIRSLPLEEIKNTYLTVYSDTRNISIGWWNDFIMDSVAILSNTFCAMKLDAFAAMQDSLRVFPLMADAPRNETVSLETLEDLALLLRDMGAGDITDQAAEEVDPLEPLLRPVLFRGAAARAWAQTLYQFAAAASNASKPLAWTLSQPPIDIQGKLFARGRLLAVNRFRYLEVSAPSRTTKSFNTYTNQKTTLAEGVPTDRGLSFRFYRASSDREPSVTLSLSQPWAIFDIYLQRDLIRDDQDITYFPLYIQDPQGQYVYFTQLEFNAPLPAPDRWPTFATWPNFRIIDGAVTAGR